MHFPSLLTTLSVAILLTAIYTPQKGLAWVSKPAASIGFLLIALEGPKMTNTPYGRAIFLGLVLGFLGDVLLINGDDLTFTLGLGSFLIGHIAYGVAFYRNGVNWMYFLITLIPMSILGGIVKDVCWPNVPQDMKAPLILYIVVLSGMVGLAVGGAPFAEHPRKQIVGALIFAVSDIMVAKERFIDNSIWNPVIGLPLYYAAQHIIASTVY